MIGEILQTLIKAFLHLFQEKHFRNISQLRLGKNMSRVELVYVCLYLLTLILVNISQLEGCVSLVWCLY